MKLQICYLTDTRRHFAFEPFLHFLTQSKRRHLWSLVVLTHEDDSAFYNDILKNVEINSAVIQVESVDGNYLNKVRTGALLASKSNIPYVMKCDNDLFFSGATLDYMIDHLDILNQFSDTTARLKHLTLSPVLTNGIPTVEYFVRDFLTPEAQAEVNSRFLRTAFYARDGADYTPLNRYTIGVLESESAPLTHACEKWQPAPFFENVRELPTHYKGVHPVRFNAQANHYINEYVVANKHAFFERAPTGLITEDKYPYLCNSVFCIRTDLYLRILDDASLYVDGYDEVPVNKFADQTGLNHVFVENGYALHMMYNWEPNHFDYERRLCDQLFEK